TGRSLGIRADITPQVARIDAHSLRREGPVRLCYAGTVLHTRPQSLLASRSPIQIGAELYGDPGLASDSEVVLLMLETLRTASFTDITRVLVHVGISREVTAPAQLDAEAEAILFDALQRKSPADVAAILNRTVTDAELRARLLALSELQGGFDV